MMNDSSSTPTPDSDLVLSERRGSVLLLTLNRPDRLNAWNDALEARYFECLDGAEADEEVRAIVVTGAGRGFCAGADMDVLEGVDPDDLSIFDRPRPRHFPMTIRKPLIAAINGAAFGLGLVEALFCDLRFCARSAKLSTVFVRRGLIAEYGSAWILNRLVGQSAALDLLLSGRTVLGEEARELGLVDRVYDDDEVLEAALAYAAELADFCSPTSMAVIKEQLQQGLDWTFPEAIEDAEVKIRESIFRPDLKEGVASYLERRPPAFPPLEPGRASS